MRRSSGKVPLLAVPVLAGGDDVDDTALSVLVKRAVEDRKKEEAAARGVSSSVGSFQAHVERSARQAASWWDSLTPAQQADLQAARAAVGREQKERSQEVPKRRKRKKRRRRRRRPGTSCW